MIVRVGMIIVCPDSYIHLLSHHSIYIAGVETRLFKICSLSPKERVFNLFQEFDMIITCPNYKQIWIPDLLTDKDIAQLTGLTRQTVSKILRSWPGNKQEPFYSKKKMIP